MSISITHNSLQSRQPRKRLPADSKAVQRSGALVVVMSISITHNSSSGERVGNSARSLTLDLFKEAVFIKSISLNYRDTASLNSFSEKKQLGPS